MSNAPLRIEPDCTTPAAAVVAERLVDGFELSEAIVRELDGGARGVKRPERGFAVGPPRPAGETGASEAVLRGGGCGTSMTKRGATSLGEASRVEGTAASGDAMRGGMKGCAITFGSVPD